MNPLIINRDGRLPADHWYQIEVTGEHYNRAAGLVQVIDAQAVESIVNRFAQAAQAPNFAGILIDQDHFSLDPTKSTEAFGWLKELRNRAGQLEGRVEWTDIGKPAVESGRFKFFSTVYAAADVEKLGDRVIRNGVLRPAVRPLALDRLAVTNDPNNKGGKPISNRDPGTPSDAEKTQIQPTTMKLIIAELGLPEASTEDQIITAVKALKTGAAEAPAIKNRLATAETELATLRTAQMTADLDARKAKITNREAVERMYRADRDGTLALLDGIQAGAAAPDKITNRATAQTPAAREAEQTQADKADAEVRAYKIANRCSYEDAHAAVRRLKPDLFA